MKIERGEGGALVVRWSRLSSTTVWIVGGLSLAVLVSLAGRVGLRGPAEVPPWLWAMGAAAVAGVFLLRAAMTTVWRIGGGWIVREGSWLRAERRWTADRNAEVELACRVTSGRNAHERWSVLVRSGGEAISFGEKANAEAQARQAGEAIARELGASLRYGPAGVAIRAEHLDLPFVERVVKYPALRVAPRPRPDGVGIREEVLGSSRVFRWRALNVFTLVTVVGLAAFVLVYVAADSPAARRFFLEHPEWIAGALGVPLVLLAGVGYRLSAGPQGVEYEVTMYGVPVRTRGISAMDLEEVWVRRIVHTPVLQMASDREIVRCRVYRWKGDAVLEWLAGEVQGALGGSFGASHDVV